MKSPATVRSDLSLPSDLHQALKSAVALRKTTMKSAIEQGILMWLRQDPSQDEGSVVLERGKVVPLTPSGTDEALITSMAHIQSTDPDLAAALRLLINRADTRSTRNEQSINVGAVAAEGRRLAEAVLSGVAGTYTSATQNTGRTGVSPRPAGSSLAEVGRGRNSKKTRP